MPWYPIPDGVGCGCCGGQCVECPHGQVSRFAVQAFHLTNGTCVSLFPCTDYPGAYVFDGFRNIMFNTGCAWGGSVFGNAAYPCMAGLPWFGLTSGANALLAPGLNSHGVPSWVLEFTIQTAVGPHGGGPSGSDFPIAQVRVTYHLPRADFNCISLNVMLFDRIVASSDTPAYEALAESYALNCVWPSTMTIIPA